MDYKAMWEELKRNVELNMKFYSESTELSTLEAAYGFGEARRTLRYMEHLEETYSNTDGGQ